MHADRIPNAHYAGSPARMQDGRLFTDYRSNCIPQSEFGGSFEDKERMQKEGQKQIQTDRYYTAVRAATTGCVDTMVPELTKRICAWNGCKTLHAHSVGIGNGRMYLPARADMVAGDPDTLAAATAFKFGTFPVRASPPKADLARAVLPDSRNRYSAPYA